MQFLAIILGTAGVFSAMILGTAGVFYSAMILGTAGVFLFSYEFIGAPDKLQGAIFMVDKL